MRLAHISGGFVVNVIESDDLIEGFIESNSADIGDNYDGEMFTKPIKGPVLTVAQLLSARKLEKEAEIKAGVGGAIVAGISSAALGQPHTYPTSRDDQSNLNGLITESLLPGSGDEYKFWCVDSDGVWARRVHTKLQIQSLGKAVADHVKSRQEKYEQRLHEIALADASNIDLIVW